MDVGGGTLGTGGAVGVDRESESEGRGRVETREGDLDEADLVPRGGLKEIQGEHVHVGEVAGEVLHAAAHVVGCGIRRVGGEVEGEGRTRRRGLLAPPCPAGEELPGVGRRDGGGVTRGGGGGRSTKRARVADGLRVARRR